MLFSMVDIKLVIEPRVVKTWEQFTAEAPPFSIALDGYVYGRPRYNLTEPPRGPHLNRNHHEEVDRLSTLSTSGQVNNDIKSGLYEKFQVDGIPTAIPHINDSDEDTCLAVWQLRHSDRIAGYKSEPLINRLIYAADKLDVFAGAYPFDPNSDVMRDLFWIFENYASQRSRVSSMGVLEVRSIIEAVGSRIDAYTVGKGGQLSVDVSTQYEILHRGHAFSLVRETGPYAKTGLLHDGVSAFALLKSVVGDRYHYSIGKFSPFNNFPVTDLYPYFNQLEGFSALDTDIWGGGDIIGGSARNRGSAFPPGQLFTRIQTFLEKK